MNALLSALLVAVAVPAAYIHCDGYLFSRQVCYGDLGCYSTDPPFRSLQRPITLLPEDPQKIGTEFLLYTRSNPTFDVEQRIISANAESLHKSNFQGNKTTKFIIHGFTHNAHENWVKILINEILKLDDVNVITVDWNGGAKLPYTQATSNTRVVGAEVAKFLQFLQKEAGVSPKSIHLIGHSLGAHVSGYAGTIIKQIGRITGLDPAQPYFENTDPLVRLDPSDALFVDVIHSDASGALALGLGLFQPIGHVDFYPNGGYEQPGCDNSFWSKLGGTVWNVAKLDKYGVEAALACSHTRAIELFTESINSRCPFTSYPCADYDTFKTGSCLQSCQNDQCMRMGYHANPSAKGRGSMYLLTQDSYPFCNYHYVINVTSGLNQKTARGNVLVSFKGGLGQTKDYQLTKTDSDSIKTGQSLTKLVTSPTNLGTVDTVNVSFKKYNSLLAWLYPDSWKIGKVTVTSGEGKYTSKFCTSDLAIYSNGKKTFTAGGSC